MATTEPPAWSKLRKSVVFWHGCLSSHAASIRTNGVDVTRGNPATDFGRGFYTTTYRAQAVYWAQQRWRKCDPGQQRGELPAILEFRTPLERLAALDALMFVRGDLSAHSFWSFVTHCRASTDRRVNSHRHPGRERPNDWYDLVCGPVTLWPQRTLAGNYDQFSFHTPAGAAILNTLIEAGSPHFRVIPAPGT